MDVELVIVALELVVDALEFDCGLPDAMSCAWVL